MWLEKTDSSNDLAVELIDMYFEEDERFPTTVLVAESEPGAHGRKGHWAAPAGRGLYFTFVRQARAGEPISLMPIAVARWLRDALRDATGLRIHLKWPNDLYIGRRKVGGILAEARTQGDDTYVAVGVGLNVLGLGRKPRRRGRDDARGGGGPRLRARSPPAGRARPDGRGARRAPLVRGSPGVGESLGPPAGRPPDGSPGRPRTMSRAAMPAFRRRAS